MQVSFGKIYAIYDDKIIMPTNYQIDINYVIAEAFQNISGLRSKEEISVEKLLEETKNADIFIKNNTDGSVDLEIRQDVYDFNGEFGKKYLGFVPYDAKGKQKLKLENIKIKNSENFVDILKGIGKIKKKVDKFTKKCEKYAIEPLNEKNAKLAYENDIEWEKQLIKVDRAIIKQIEDMENFNFGN